MPMISVVLPTFNRSELLVNAIQTVLAQKKADFELIISDNCSTDNTEEAVKPFLTDYRVKYYRNSSNIGMVGNWRRAIFDLTSAEWFIIMSDDDHFIDEEYLNKASSLIDAHSSIKFVYAGGYILNEENGKTKLLRPPFSGVVPGMDVFLSRGTVKPQDITLCNMVFKKRDSAEMGFLTNEDNLSCDSELYLKLALTGDVGVIPEPVSLYRFHAGNLVKRTLTSARYIHGNLDYLVEPYFFAKTRLRADELDKFRRNVNLDKFIKSSLERLAAYRPSLYIQTLETLKQRIPDVMESVCQSFIFKMRIKFILKHNLLVNRYMKIGE